MRSFSAVVAVLLATLIAPFAIGATWVTARVDDRQEYVDTVGDLSGDPAVQDVLSTAAANAAVKALQRYVPVGLPGAVRDWAKAAAEKVVQGPAFPEFWRSANGQIHDQVVAILEDPNAPTDGAITVDASLLVAQVLLQLEDRGIPVSVIPKVSLTVPVASEAKVAQAGPIYRTADRVNRLLPIAWALLVVLALVVAHGWRGRVRTAGFALLGVGLAVVVLLVATDPLTTAVIDDADAKRRELLGVLLDAVVGSLQPYARGFLIAAPVGLVLVALSLLPRRTPSSAIRGAEDPLTP
ncbi:hypothetical protein GCM10022237_22920 [Nocardioides ginsengisoli]|uniref:Integral membrane protein n=1 Tax=Nocardioides ginsengisoli TaxID=363868 RepID=A0ABW3W457_9ACTN